MKYYLTKAYGGEVASNETNDAMIWFKAYYTHYDSMLQSSSQSNVSSSPEVIGSTSMLSRSSARRKLRMELGSHCSRRCAKRNDTTMECQQNRSHCSRRCEIDTYLEDSLASGREGEDFDILKWWKTKSDQYPVLASMARDFLAIPLSSVASESTFSTAGMIIDKYRNSLSPKTVEALICTKDWLKDCNSDDEVDDDNNDDD
jgi:hypothetical protein